MKKFDKPQKAILLYLMKRKNKLRTSVSVFEEKLCSKFSENEISNAAIKLRDQGLIEINGGSNISARIYDNKALKKLKKDFCGNLAIYWIWSGLTQLWMWLWKHFLITIITSAITSTAVTIMVNIIQKKYFPAE